MKAPTQVSAASPTTTAIILDAVFLALASPPTLRSNSPARSVRVLMVIRTSSNVVVRENVIDNAHNVKGKANRSRAAAALNGARRRRSDFAAGRRRDLPPWRHPWEGRIG
jgi:hypothetical protein